MQIVVVSAVSAESALEKAAADSPMAKAMQTLVSDADLRSRYGAAAKKRVETVFAEDVVMQQVYDVLADSIL